MTITGKMKFFDQNRISSDTAFSLTTANTSLAQYLYDNNNSTQLISIASSDTVSEVWTLDMGGTQAIDRAFITNHNINQGTMKYFSTSAFVDFSPAISWTSTSQTDTNYYEFTGVNTTKIQLTMDTTQVADQQKQVGEIRLVTELGTVENNPQRDGDPIFNENSKNLYTDDNSNVNVYFGDKYRSKFKFENANQNDLDLFRSLKNRRQSFYVYPNGGCTTNCPTQEGWRNEDMYLVNYVNDYRWKAPNGLFSIGAEITLDLQGAY